MTTSGRLRIWAFSRPRYTPESCDGLQRHDHVMLLQGVLITVETPIYLNGFRSIIRIGSTLSHSRILKTCPGYSCSCPRRTPCNDYIIRYITTTRWHACSVLAPLRRCLADPQIRSCGDFWCKQHSVIVRTAVFLRRVVVDFRHRWMG